MTHQTVLTNEAVDGLQLTKDAVVIDCTYGSGGHSREILNHLGPKGRLLSLDADPTALNGGSIDERHTLLCGNFRDITLHAESVGMKSVDAILADLGWRSEQFEGGGKGFSFQNDEPLQMTFGDPEQYVFTAHDVVNSWAEENLADIIFGYGEERGARLVAAAIVEARKEGEIKTSAQLANIVEAAIGHFYKRQRIHPATKTFQAIRITVNDELGALSALLNSGFQLLAPTGRLAIISFHSLEDRVVKRHFTSLVHNGLATRVTKKPIIPTKDEIINNPRARSAKLRIIEKLP